MTTAAEQVLELKTEAKNLRDLGLVGYPDAVETLQSAIAIAEAALKQTTLAGVVRQMAKELADCHGMVGGIQRRWGLETEGAEQRDHLARSCLAYDDGWRYEWNEAYAIQASYNLVNRLTGRLLMRPDLLTTPGEFDLGGGVQAKNLPQQLADARKCIDQTLARKGNFWAEADLALLTVLLTGAEPATAYAGFLALSPPAYAFDSVLDGLRPLARLDFKATPQLQAAERWLVAQRPTA
jgi:hypothetical protein